MYSVSDEYKALSTAAVRNHNIDLTFYHLVNGSYEKYAAYYEREDNPIISLKIINGQTTGGFSIGGSYCSTLEITAHINVPFQVNDKVEVQTHFRAMDDASGSEWLFQGVFYIDTITANQYNVKITALDAMARLAKDYNSELSYPATINSMLSEISVQSGVGLSGIDVFNNASIATKPVKATDEHGNEVYFTRREVLGYLAGINGGNAYINNIGQISFSAPRETNYRIKWENVISQTFGGADLTIDNVVLNKSGTTNSTADDWDTNAVQLYAPLDVGEDVVAPIKQKLSGVHYEAIALKKQGTGMFEPGDLVTYTALDGSYHKMLVMGIVYELTNGFFSETLYSLAQSGAQRQYSGVQNISQNISSGGGSSLAPVSSYEYISDNLVKMNGTTFEVEKNAAGLITKITGGGRVLRPTGGSNITDIALHNAVFWATVMARGIMSGMIDERQFIFSALDELCPDPSYDVYIYFLTSNAYSAIKTKSATFRLSLATCELARSNWDAAYWMKGNVAYIPGLPIARKTKPTALKFDDSGIGERIISRGITQMYISQMPVFKTSFYDDWLKAGEDVPLKYPQFRDFFDYSNVSNPTGAMLYKWKNDVILMFFHNNNFAILDDTNERMVETLDGQYLYIGEYFPTSNNRVYAEAFLNGKVTLQMDPNTGYGISYYETLRNNLEANVYFNTEDLCDEKGNVLLPKNCDLSFFI